MYTKKSYKFTLKIINNYSNYSTFYIIHKSLQFYEIDKINTMTIIYKVRNNICHLICKNYIQLHFIIYIYFNDLKLQKIENLSVYISQVLEYVIT